MDDGLLLTAAKFGEPVYPSGSDPVGGGGIDGPDGGIFNQRDGLYGRCIRQAQKYQIRRIQQLFPLGGILSLRFVYEQQVDIAACGKAVIDLETSGAVLAVNVNLRFQ